MEFNNDGSVSNTSKGFDLVNKRKEIINTGQIGFGPFADFSFGIAIEDQEKLINGLTVRYEGFNLYKYERKKT
jgi:hypothetical protein